MTRRIMPVVLTLAAVATGLAATSVPANAAITVPTTMMDEAYGSVADHQVVTVYRPNSPQAPGRRPVAYFIHGGGWTHGSRSSWATQAREWASHGWVSINIDYRFATDAGDGAKLLADVTTVVEHYEAAGYTDASRQVIIGDSAGGHLATTIGAKLRGHFVGVIAWSPVAIPENAATDGERPGAAANQVELGVSAMRFFAYSYGTTNAVKYVTAYGGPPMWLAGSTDEWVTWSHQGGALCNTLTAINSKLCEKHVEAGTLHGTALRDAEPALQASAYDFAIRRIGTVK